MNDRTLSLRNSKTPGYMKKPRSGSLKKNIISYQLTIIQKLNIITHFRIFKENGYKLLMQ